LLRLTYRLVLVVLQLKYEINEHVEMMGNNLTNQERIVLFAYKKTHESALPLKVTVDANTQRDVTAIDYKRVSERLTAEV